MKRISNIAAIGLFLICVCFCVGCNPETAIPIREYPPLCEIDPITTYSSSGQWQSNAVCWVGVCEDAKWNGFQSQYSRNNMAKDIVPLVREELRESGCEVKVFENEYITRSKRLSIQKMIFCKEFSMKKTRVKEGICYDMKLVVIVSDNGLASSPIVSEVWGRCLVEKGQSKSWPEIYRACVSNLCRVPEFRRSLEILPPM